jgi:hypothetical protein
MNDRDPPRNRDRTFQEARDFVDSRDLAGLVSFPLLGPQPDLPLQVSLAVSGVPQPDRRWVDRVQFTERVNELLADPIAVRWSVERGGDLIAQREAVQRLHEIEGCTDDRRVVALQKRDRHPHGLLAQREEIAIFAQDVVSGGLERRTGWSAKDVGRSRRADKERRVRVARVDPFDIRQRLEVQELTQPLPNNQRRSRQPSSLVPGVDHIPQSTQIDGGTIGHRQLGSSRPRESRAARAIPPCADMCALLQENRSAAHQRTSAPGPLPVDLHRCHAHG